MVISVENYVNLSPEELRHLQLKELEILLYFKEFCEKHNLLFYFCGGCCIGTVRNGGFIPWDDDIDIFMPREDYEKLFVLWQSDADTNCYSCLRTTKEQFVGNIFTTVVDENTTCIKPPQKKLDIPQGIALDIMPLDGCPSSRSKRKMQKLWALLFSLYIAQVVPKNHGFGVSFFGALLLAVVPFRRWRCVLGRLCERKMTQYKINDCKYITELCAGPHYMQNEYPKELFESAVYKSFEGYEMPIPVGYDTYLSIAFGDYMSMPPEEKQVAHHDFLFLDINNSYKKYKGKHYL